MMNNLFVEETREEKEQYNGVKSKEQMLDITKKVNEMLEMQNALNNAIFTKHNVEPSETRVKIAMIDEIGELTHELKAKWCWWKKTQAPTDRNKVLAELVDVWHFLMTLWIMQHKDRFEVESYQCETVWVDKKLNSLSKYQIMIKSLIAYPPTIGTIMTLTEILGFTMDEVYKEYINKNQENYERLKKGY